MAIKPKTDLGVQESVGSAANFVAPADGDGMTGGWKTRFSVPACGWTAAWPKKG